MGSFVLSIGAVSLFVPTLVGFAGRGIRGLLQLTPSFGYGEGIRPLSTAGQCRKSSLGLVFEEEYGKRLEDLHQAWLDRKRKDLSGYDMNYQNYPPEAAKVMSCSFELLIIL